MVRSLAISEREYGGQLANFERIMIGMEHAGWLTYLGLNRCTLSKSPFQKNLAKSVIYLLPPDFDAEENTLVEFEVGRPIKEYPDQINKNDNLFEWGEESYEVQSWKKLDIEKMGVLKPYLTKDEFLHRISKNWEGAHYDHLDMSMAIQLMSCPPGEFGIGGIGSQTLNAGGGGGKGKLLRFGRSLQNSIPREFLNGNQSKSHHFIRSKDNAREVDKLRKSDLGNEINYNYLTIVDEKVDNLPIQIPSIINHSVYRPEQNYNDYDVMEYYVTSFMWKPVISRTLLDKIEKEILFVHNQIYPELEDIPINVDPQSVGKIALALTRLNLTNKLDESGIKESREYVKDTFKELFDLKKNIFPPGSPSYSASNIETTSSNSREGEYDLRVLRHILRIKEETGDDSVLIDVLAKECKKAGISAFELSEALNSLWERGKIIQTRNWSMVKPMKV